MVPEWLMALLMLLKERWSTRRDAHVRFLKLQVEILRSRLPGNRVIPDPVERKRLMPTSWITRGCMPSRASGLFGLRFPSSPRSS